MGSVTKTSATAKLDAYYDLVRKLTTSSSEGDLAKVGSFFSHDCSTNLRSMREEPKIGRQAALNDLKDLVESQHVDERRIVAQVELSTSTEIAVFCQMSNRLNIMGDIVDPYNETAVVEFDSDGLISDFKLYGCRSPIVRIVQEKTKLGPYSEEYMAEDEHLPGVQPKM